MSDDPCEELVLVPGDDAALIAASVLASTEGGSARAELQFAIWTELQRRQKEANLRVETNP